MVYIPNTGTCRPENYPFWTLGTQWFHQKVLESLEMRKQV